MISSEQHDSRLQSPTRHSSLLSEHPPPGYGRQVVRMLVETSAALAELTNIPFHCSSLSHPINSLSRPSEDVRRPSVKHYFSQSRSQTQSQSQLQSQYHSQQPTSAHTLTSDFLTASDIPNSLQHRYGSLDEQTSVLQDGLVSVVNDSCSPQDTKSNWSIGTESDVDPPLVETIAVVTSFLRTLHAQLAASPGAAPVHAGSKSRRISAIVPNSSSDQNQRPPLCSIALNQIKLPTNEHDASLLGMTAPVDDLDVGLDGVPVESDDELDPDYLDLVRQRSLDVTGADTAQGHVLLSVPCHCGGAGNGGNCPHSKPHNDPHCDTNIRKGSTSEHSPATLENETVADRATLTIDHALQTQPRLRSARPPRSSSSSFSRKGRKNSSHTSKPTYRSQPIMGRPKRLPSSRSIHHLEQGSTLDFPVLSTSHDGVTMTHLSTASLSTASSVAPFENLNASRASHAFETDNMLSAAAFPRAIGTTSSSNASFADIPRASPPSRIQLGLSSSNSFATINSGSRRSLDGVDGGFAVPDKVQLHADYACVFHNSTGYSSHVQNCSAIETAARELYVSGPIEEHWKIGKLIAYGGFSFVKRGKRKSGSKIFSDITGRDHIEDVAIKFLEKSGPCYKEMHVAREVFTARLFRLAGGNDHVVNVHAVYEDRKYVYIVMELLEGGELFQRISSYGPYTEKFAANLVVSMLDGLSFCHRLNVTHRDVKAENFVFRTKHSRHRGPFSDGIDLKLIDFGVCFYDEDPNALCKTMAGSATYVAPEIVSRNAYGPEADMWSLGVLVYIMLVGYPPFDDNDLVLLIRKIKYKPPEFNESHWNRISKEARDFVSNLLDKDPLSRMTSRQALEHEWLRNNCHAASDAQLDIQDRLKELAGVRQSSDSDHTDGFSPPPPYDGDFASHDIGESSHLELYHSDSVIGTTAVYVTERHSAVGETSDSAHDSCTHEQTVCSSSKTPKIATCTNDANEPSDRSVFETGLTSPRDCKIASGEIASTMGKFHSGLPRLKDEPFQSEKSMASKKPIVVDETIEQQYVSSSAIPQPLSGRVLTSSGTVQRPTSESNVSSLPIGAACSFRHAMEVTTTSTAKSDSYTRDQASRLDNFSSISLGNIRECTEKPSTDVRSASMFPENSGNTTNIFFGSVDPFDDGEQRRMLSDGDSMFSSGFLSRRWRSVGGGGNGQNDESTRGFSGFLGRLSARVGASGRIDADGQNMRGSYRWTRHGLGAQASSRRSQKASVKKCFGADERPLHG